MSVGKGSIKRAAGASKPATKTKVQPKNSEVKAVKKVEPKASTKAENKTTVKKQALPVSNSTAGKNFGVGDELPIFLM